MIHVEVAVSVMAEQWFSGWFRRFFPKRTLGQRGEAAAARYLRRRGYKVLARGDRFGPGETRSGDARSPDDRLCRGQDP